MMPELESGSARDPRPTRAGTIQQQPFDAYENQRLEVDEYRHRSELGVREPDIRNNMDLTVGDTEVYARGDGNLRRVDSRSSAGYSAGTPANRFYASSVGTSRTGSRESFETSHSARDRKRRLTSTGEDARLQRTRSSGTDDRISAYARQTLPHRSVSMLVSPSRETIGDDRPAPMGSSYATAIDISSSPPEQGSPGASFGRVESSRMARSRARVDGNGGWSMDLPRRRPAPGSHANTHLIGAAPVFPRESSGISRDRQALQNGDREQVDMAMPRWQPDSEVTSCPICGMVFSFWYRKHHCRKCGRVVCASCSPHRITIPRQYIVRPPESNDLPESSSTPTRLVIDLTEDNPVLPTSPINPALGGGEEVRLCNPCVPDPNPNPLSYTAIHHRGHRSTHSLSSAMGNTISRVWDNGIPTSESTAQTSRRAWDPQYGQPYRPPLSRQAPSEESVPTPSRPRRATALPGVNPQWQPLPPSVRPEPPTSQDSQRPAVSEQDFCPICRRGFPPLSNEQPLEAREAHIRHCIESYGAPPGQREQRSARQAPQPVAARMVEFIATEKDCLGGDGSLAECTICMEEYEVGQTLARLECFCKFHKGCIVNWFTRKMECPVHKET